MAGNAGLLESGKLLLLGLWLLGKLASDPPKAIVQGSEPLVVSELFRRFSTMPADEIIDSQVQAPKPWQLYADWAIECPLIG